MRGFGYFCRADVAVSSARDSWMPITLPMILSRIHVGARVRERRLSPGMSQRDLGEYLRLTFQQIQKYEKETNRISANKLWALSHFFKVPIEWFFEGLGEPSQEREGVMTKQEARQLARYYSACPASTKNHLRALFRATADMSGKSR